MKNDISFYQLTTTSLNKALPQLLYKIINNNQRAEVLLATLEQINDLDNHLWTFSSKTLIPHGKFDDDYANMQPVLLVNKISKANDAEVLVIVEDVEFKQIDNYAKVIYMFDGNIEKTLNKVKQTLLDVSKKGYNINYWQQDIKGNWGKTDNYAQTV